MGVDINDNKAQAAKDMGATDFVNPTKCEGGDPKSTLLAKEKWVRI